jgi:alkylation response protein AidB-like acyl-CoA dehydrogenase
VDLSPDEVSQAARDAVRAVCLGQSGSSAAASPARAREAEPLGHDAKLWAELCGAGIPGLAVAEELGGGGADLLALVAVVQELGAVLAPVPLVEHAVAARLLASVAPGHPDLAAVVDGELIATLAPRVRAGLAQVVPAGAVADLVIGCDGDELVAVRSAPPMQSLANQGNLPVADRDLTSGVRTVLLTGHAARDAFEAANREWLTLVAGWLAGASAAALELVTRWVKERHQFGVPIGSFQGIQHGLADLPGLIDGAGLIASEAAWALETGTRSITGADGAQLALMAIVFAADSARLVTGRAVQYYRRASAYPLLTGAPRMQLRELGGDLLAEGNG